ncbi:MAG: ROK family protein [Candidatus Krumholzibacteria bacterium]|nr:ROK family protein [Candidatus Krumholzibacteria bacterium]
MERILGIDIGGTDVKTGIVSIDGSIESHGTIETRPEEGPDALAGRVRDWYHENLAGHSSISVAGLACAGLVDSRRGILYNSPNLDGWTDVPLGKIFGEKLGMAVTVENDVNAAVWGEYLLGSGKGTSSFVALTLGTGVGGGIVLNGTLYRGARGSAGEIGHHVILADGPRCACGSRGCLEALIGSQAIRARAARKSSGTESLLAGKDDHSVKEIYEAAAGGDAAAIETFEETGRYLGIGLANIVHILNPDRIAIGGGIAGAGEMILGPARESMKRHLMGDILQDIEVVPAVLGNTASFLGAAMLAAAGAGLTNAEGRETESSEDEEKD